MGEFRDSRLVGKQAPRGKNNVLPPATIVDPDRFVMYRGKKLKGAVVISEKGVELQGEQSDGTLKPKRLLRVPLVLWSQARRIEIDGHGYERHRGRSLIASDFQGHLGLGATTSTHTAASSNLVVTTDTQQVAWTLPIDPVRLRNLLGRVIVEVENRASSPPSTAPPPSVAEPPPPPTPAGWYHDPSRRHEHRYWTGSDWSEHVADAGVQATDPA
jgi:hypothetical protein